MYHEQQTEIVRREVVSTLEELGATTGDCLVETLLIRDGYYCGRRFYCDGYQAVWFIEEAQIKYFDTEGQLVKKSEQQVVGGTPTTSRRAVSA